MIIFIFILFFIGGLYSGRFTRRIREEDNIKERKEWKEDMEYVFDKYFKKYDV